jgi:hypothetical protein
MFSQFPTVCTIAMLSLIQAPGSASPQMRRKVSNAPYRVGISFAGMAGDGQGLPIHDVLPGGAGASAGLKPGDVITHMNGTEVSGSASDYAHLFGSPTPIAVRVRRNGESLAMSLAPRRATSAAETTAQANRANRAPAAPGVTRIPTQMDFGKPTVNATINGQGPWQFFVDSGAGVTVIDQALVRELELASTGKRRIGGPDDPEAISADIIPIDSILIGSVEFRDVESVSWDRSELYQTKGRPRGVLGIGLFSDYLLSFDYPAGEIVLRKGELPPVDHKEIIPFSLTDYGLPAIQISVGGKTMAAHFDTGSPGSLGLPGSMEHELKLKAPPTVLGKARTVGAEFEIRGSTLDGDLHIGSHVFQSPQIMLLDVLDDMNVANIGSRLLRDFKLTFDQKNKRLRLSRP